MKLNRRSFLKKALAAGSLAAGTGSLFSACAGIRRSDLPDQNLAEPTANQLDAVGNSILYYASLAPSSHNSQPWYVRVLSPNEWIVGVDPHRRLPAVDPGNREVMLSLGAFTENLSIAAHTFGLKAEMEVLAKDPFEQDVIKVTLKKAKPLDYSLERITRRMTVKHGYLSNEIKAEDISIHIHRNQFDCSIKSIAFHVHQASQAAKTNGPRIISNPCHQLLRLQTIHSCQLSRIAVRKIGQIS